MSDDWYGSATKAYLSGLTVTQCPWCGYTKQHTSFALAFNDATMHKCDKSNLPGKDRG